MLASGKKNPHQSGFTLIELMVVVAIIAFVSAAVVPSFSSNLLRGRQREAGHLIIQGVVAARTLAARTGRLCRVTIGPDQSFDDGGDGGTVQVECARDENRCSQWRFELNYNNFSNKCVGCDAASLVGTDVEIIAGQSEIPSSINTIAAGDEEQIYFEPAGGMCNPAAYAFVVQDANGVHKNLVTLSPGGSMSYSLCTIKKGGDLCR